MAKRKAESHGISSGSTNSPTNKSVKKPKLEPDIYDVRCVVVRNDDDPHVFINNTDLKYVTIGEYIYKVKTNHPSWSALVGDDDEESIGLNFMQHEDVEQYVHDRDKIFIRSYHNPAITTVNKMVVRLENDSSYKQVLKRKDLTNYIRNLLCHHIVSVDQSFHINFGNQLTMRIIEADDKMIGKVILDTQIDYKYLESSIVICEDCVKLDSDKVYVYLTRYVSLQTGESKSPLIMGHINMSNYVCQAINRQVSFTDNDKLVYIGPHFELTFIIKLLDPPKTSKYKHTYQLSNNGIIDVRSNIDDVIITKEELDAVKICFSCGPKFNQHYDPQDYLLIEDNVVNYIRKNINVFTNNQEFRYLHGKKELLLTINYVYPHSTNSVSYRLVDSTKITFDTDKKSRFIIVNNSEPVKATKVLFSIKKISMINLFQLLFGIGGDSNAKTQIFDSTKLEKIARNMFPKITTLRHQMKMQLKGQPIMLVVKELTFDDDSNKTKYPTRVLLTDETEFKFEISKSNKSMAISNKLDSALNPIVELEKHVGGLSNELKTIVRTMALARGKLKSEFAARGLKPAKGMIFYGPPGCGKTTIARQFGKVFGCDGDRFRLMSGPEIFNKWLGQSEQNVREIFKPAKEAWKKLGEESPLYMVVIDEIDAMLPVRTGSSNSPARDSVVNQFLAELDGLVEFNNFICIGLTNRLSLLDDAVLRPGRLGTHVKIDLPNKEGRLKIFEIHTRKLKDINRLRDVNFDELVKITEEFSGADIEGIVANASSYSLERLNELDKIDDAIIREQGMILHSDFVKAIEEFKKTNKNVSGVSLISHLYT